MMHWTESEINKTIKKYESVEIYREIEDKEITIQVYYDYHDRERAYFNPMKGEGHPGSAEEIEIILALNEDKQPVILTDEEEEQAKQIILNELEDDFEDPPDSYDRERDLYED